MSREEGFGVKGRKGKEVRARDSLRWRVDNFQEGHLEAEAGKNQTVENVVNLRN